MIEINRRPSIGIRSLVFMLRGGLLGLAVLTANLRAVQPAGLGSGSEGSATLLGVEGKGTKFVYVFDHSGSMGVPANKPLDRAKKELLASIDGISDVQQFYIIFYNQDQKVFRIDPTGGRLIFGTVRTKSSQSSLSIRSGPRGRRGTSMPWRWPCECTPT